MLYVINDPGWKGVTALVYNTKSTVLHQTLTAEKWLDTPLALSTACV